MAIQIVSRAEWGARPPTSRFLIPVPTPKLWLHHTASPTGGPARVRAIQVFHQDVRGWSDIAYSYLVSAAGIIYEGRGAGVAGGHTAGQNTVSHAVCAMGNYDTTTPAPAMLDSIRQLLAHGHAEGWWPAQFTGGHRDAPAAATSCPGSKLYALIPTINKIQEADMPLTSDDLEKVRQIVWFNADMRDFTTGSDLHAATLLRHARNDAFKAALDAAVARRLAEEMAARGSALTPIEIDAIGEEVAKAFIEALTD